MLAQIYKEENFIRVFISEKPEKWLVMDLSTPAHYLPKYESIERLEISDRILHWANFRRREKWQKTDFGWEAKIRRNS